MQKQFSFYTSIGLSLILGLIIAGYIFGWTTPTANPPSSNLAAPLNTGSTNQAKTGYLAIGTSTTPSFPLVVGGVLRVGNISSAPTGAPGALYYDTTLNDFRGYKSSGWASLGASLPSGSSNQTLRYGTSEWESSSFLVNTGSAIGIGTTTPQSALDVTGNIIVRTSTSTVTIKADQSVSTNLNADKLDGYEAADLLGSTSPIKYRFVCAMAKGDKSCIKPNPSSCPEGWQDGGFIGYNEGIAVDGVVLTTCTTECSLSNCIRDSGTVTCQLNGMIVEKMSDGWISCLCRICYQ